jgi:DNA helicase-2/ATP-dependent DNA helicase PcrA
MTVHSAKGLEYDTVFITGLEEGMFPIIHMEEEDGIEEERRLFYVAVTRAKRMLYITYANERMQYGSHEMKSRSRFLKEVPPECFEDVNREKVAEKKIEDLQRNINRNISNNMNSLFKGSFGIREEEKKPKLKSDKLSEGDKVIHKAWGVGTIVQISGEGDERKAIIAFESKGIKPVMLSYAPIEKI